MATFSNNITQQTIEYALRSKSVKSNTKELLKGCVQGKCDPQILKSCITGMVMKTINTLYVFLVIIILGIKNKQQSPNVKEALSKSKPTLNKFLNLLYAGDGKKIHTYLNSAAGEWFHDLFIAVADNGENLYKKFLNKAKAIKLASRRDRNKYSSDLENFKNVIINLCPNVHIVEDKSDLKESNDENINKTLNSIRAALKTTVIFDKNSGQNWRLPAFIRNKIIVKIYENYDKMVDGGYKPFSGQALAKTWGEKAWCIGYKQDDFDTLKRALGMNKLKEHGGGVHFAIPLDQPERYNPTPDEVAQRIARLLHKWVGSDIMKSAEGSKTIVKKAQDDAKREQFIGDNGSSRAAVTGAATQTKRPQQKSKPTAEEELITKVNFDTKLLELKDVLRKKGVALGLLKKLRFESSNSVKEARDKGYKFYKLSNRYVNYVGFCYDSASKEARFDILLDKIGTSEAAECVSELIRRRLKIKPKK